VWGGGCVTRPLRGQDGGNVARCGRKPPRWENWVEEIESTRAAEDVNQNDWERKKRRRKPRREEDAKKTKRVGAGGTFARKG